MMAKQTTFATTKMRTMRNMADVQRREIKAAVQPAWRWHLMIGAVSVTAAAIFCCYASPVLSTSGIFFSEKEAQALADSWKKLEREDHPTTFMYNDPLLREVLELFAEKAPQTRDALSEQFSVAIDSLAEESRRKKGLQAELSDLSLEDCSEESYIREVSIGDGMRPTLIQEYFDARPKLNEHIADSLKDIESEDFKKIVELFFKHMKMGRSLKENQRAVNALEKDVESKLKRGCYVVDHLEEGQYVTKPNDLSDEFATWVQIAMRRSEEGKFYIMITVHPNLDLKDPKRAAYFSFFGGFDWSIGKEPELTDTFYSIQHPNYGNLTGKRGAGWLAEQKINDNVNYDAILSKPDSKNIERTNYWTLFGHAGDIRLTEQFHADVVCGSSYDDLTQYSILQINRDIRPGIDRKKNCSVERLYPLIERNILKKSYLQQRNLSLLMEKQSEEIKEPNKPEMLLIYQRKAYCQDTKTTTMDTGLLVNDNANPGDWGTLENTVSYNLTRTWRDALPGQKLEIANVARQLSMRTEPGKYVLHVGELDGEDWNHRSLVYESPSMSSFEATPSPFSSLKVKDIRLNESIEGLARWLEPTQHKDDLSSLSDAGGNEVRSDEQLVERIDGISIRGPNGEGDEGTSISKTLHYHLGPLYLVAAIALVISAAFLNPSKKRKESGPNQDRRTSQL